MASAKRTEREEIRSLRANLRKLPAECDRVHYLWLANQAKAVADIFPEQTFGRPNPRHIRAKALERAFVKVYNVLGRGGNVAYILDRALSLMNDVMGEDDSDKPPKPEKPKKPELKLVAGFYTLV